MNGMTMPGVQRLLESFSPCGEKCSIEIIKGLSHLAPVTRGPEEHCTMMVVASSSRADLLPVERERCNEEPQKNLRMLQHYHKLLTRWLKLHLSIEDVICDLGFRLTELLPRRMVK